MDKIDKIRDSIIQHGKDSDRVYLLKYHDDEPLSLIQQLNKFCSENGYGKVIAKVPGQASPYFLLDGYVQEAFIPGFFRGGKNVFFMAKYFDEERSTLDKKNLDVFSVQLSGKSGIDEIMLPPDCDFKITSPQNCEEMAGLYRAVFETYPFPIHDPEYLRQTMKHGEVMYFGVWKRDQLVALSSAEIDAVNFNAEMTDFAVLPEMRGNKLGRFLLQKMEDEMVLLGYKTLYTIARLQSPGMNKTFLDQGYLFSGLLKNNTNISGQIESMNVYYKNIQKW